MSKSRINWDIHLVKDGFQCEECGELVDCFIPHACDCHTHGLNQYHHLELQIVVNYQPHILAYILNSIGLMIKDGRQFGAGDKVEGIFEDCDLRFDDTVDDEGKPIKTALTYSIMINNTESENPDYDKTIPRKVIVEASNGKLTRLMELVTEPTYKKVYRQDSTGAVSVVKYVKYTPEDDD